MVLMTNGTLITDENARIIAEIYDEVDISIDGIDEDSCRKIRGAGVFSKVISAIRHLKDSKLENISLSMVLTNENKQYEEKFEQLCRTLKVRPLIRSFAAEGRGKEHKDWYINSVVCEDDDDVDFEFLERRKKGQPQIELSTCEGLYGSFSIKPNGNVYLCAPMDAHLSPVCNLFDIEDVTVFFNSEIYKQTSGFKDFNEAMPDSVDRCKSCNVRYFCWSCPFIFKQATMNDKFFEQWCEFNKKDLSAAIWGE